MKNRQSDLVAIDINAVRSRMLEIRGQQVLLDRDVAELAAQEVEVLRSRKLNNLRIPAGFPQGKLI